MLRRLVFIIELPKEFCVKFIETTSLNSDSYPNPAYYPSAKPKASDQTAAPAKPVDSQHT